MKIDIKTELTTAHNKVVLAQQKVDRLFKSGKTKRDEEVKYWLEQLSAWTGYTNQLNELIKYDNIELTKTVMCSGEFHIVANHNGHYLKNVSKKNIPQEVLEVLTIGQDYSPNNPPCERCGAVGTELHHWSPKELFEDAEDWPKSFLCKKCHERWHSVMTIPFRTLRRKEQKANVKNAA